MPSILDKFQSPAAVANRPFRPQTFAQFVAFRIAHKLGEPQTAAHYAKLADRHSEGDLLGAYRRTVHSGTTTGLAERFHLELERESTNGSNGRANLIALRVERRTVAAAVFYGERLEYTQVRELATAKEKALSSAIGFVSWLANQFSLDMAALEPVQGYQAIQREALRQAIAQIIRERAVPIWDVAKTELFSAYGHPPLRSRKELREVVMSIWPILASKGRQDLIHDAVALGLYVQVERALLH